MVLGQLTTKFYIYEDYLKLIYDDNIAASDTVKESIVFWA